jgi:uncharacterized glyoxalase superfamily protein PhnB
MTSPNRSIPPYTVLPVIVYDNVGRAVEWLTRTFGFVEKVRVDDHRAQLDVGGGAVIVVDATHGRHPPESNGGVTHSTMVRVGDVGAHYREALAGGAQITAEPTDHSYGERQYSARDLEGHLWTFTESIADVAPEEWGGISVSPW